MKRFVKRPLINILFTAGLLSLSTHAMASGFQLWEQDAASVGNFHAGYAAEASDASTAWYNPAGITRFRNQQVVFAGSAINTNFRYKGSVSVTEPSLTLQGIAPVTVTFNSVSVDGGTLNFVPGLHYVAPINEQVGFGFSIGVPFGLNTDYGDNTALRYAGTLTSIRVIDISPSLGFKLNDQISFGVGFDIQRAFAEFNLIGALISPNPFTTRTVLTQDDTTLKNKVDDTGYGFHAGILYDLNVCTRVGLSYHSQVVHHFSGSSKFEGPIADIFNDDEAIVSSRATTNIKLPPYTALSIFHKVTPKWALMGSIIYTQWNTFKRLTLNQASGVTLVQGSPLPVASNNIQASIPEYYSNTVNISLGANYYATDKVILRGGLGYDQSPVQNKYRNIQLPDGDRYIVAVGGHYQLTKTVGVDAAYLHIFLPQTKINPPPFVLGVETISTNGHVNGSGDVLSGQVTWDIL
jgi:long-chain fatty acid transport protein